MFKWRRQKKADTGINEEFQQAIQDCRNAEAKLNQVTGDKMIDAAIYEAQAARLRLGHLVDQLRRNDMAAAR